MSRRRSILPPFGAKSDRRVLSVGIGLVTQKHIKIGDLAGCQPQSRITSERKTRSNAQINPAAQHRFISLDQTKLVPRQTIQSDATLPTMARLLYHVRGGIHHSTMKISCDLREGVHSAQDTLDPTFR